MAKFERVISGEFEEILNKLHKDIMDNALSMNLVDESNFELGGTKIAVRVYDKYFMRNGSRASLSLTIAENNGHVHVCAIGAGGGQGAFFNFSLGAESQLVEMVAISINSMRL